MSAEGDGGDLGLAAGPEVLEDIADEDAELAADERAEEEEAAQRARGAPAAAASAAAAAVLSSELYPDLTSLRGYVHEQPAHQLAGTFRNTGPPDWQKCMTQGLRKARVREKRVARELVGKDSLALMARLAYKVGASVGSAGASPLVLSEAQVNMRKKTVEQLMEAPMPTWWTEEFGNRSTAFYRLAETAALASLNTASDGEVEAMQRVYATKVWSKAWVQAMKNMQESGVKPESAESMGEDISADPSEPNCGVAGAVYMVVAWLKFGDLKLMRDLDFERPADEGGENQYRMNELQVLIAEACAGYQAEGFKDDDEVLLARVGETRRGIKLYKRLVSGDEPTPGEWSAALRTLFERACDHGYSGGCPMFWQLLEEPFEMRVTVAYLSVLPVIFADENGNASDPGAELPHFVEMLATRAIRSSGFATGGAMRSTPGEAPSHSSHGKTTMSIMKTEAIKDNIMDMRVLELLVSK